MSEGEETAIVGRGINTRAHVQADARAKRALAGVLAGKTQTDACLDAGFAPSTASTQSTRILRRVKGELCEELERQGFGVKALAAKLIAGAEAEMPVYHDVWEKNPNGGDSQKMRKVDMVPDPRTAALYTRQVIDVCGDAAPLKLEHSGHLSLSVEEQRKEQTRMWERLGGIG